MPRPMARALLSAAPLILMAFTADPAQAGPCRDKAGKVVACPSPVATKGDNCVSLKTSQKTRCGGPYALPGVKGPVAGQPNKKPG